MYKVGHMGQSGHNINGPQLLFHKLTNMRRVWCHPLQGHSISSATGVDRMFTDLWGGMGTQVNIYLSLVVAEDDKPTL